MFHRTLALFFLTASLLALSSLHAMNKPEYPPTKKVNVVEKLHGVEITDPYRWLEDAKSDDTKEWTAKQNAFTRSVLDKLPGRDKIHERLSALMEIGTLGTPVPVKGHYFYTKRNGKQNQAILYVRDRTRRQGSRPRRSERARGRRHGHARLVVPQAATANCSLTACRPTAANCRRCTFST